MRCQLAVAGGGLRRRRDRAGPRRRPDRARLDRPAVLRVRVCWTVPARCSPPATTRRPTTASSSAGPAPSPSARTPACRASATRSSPASPATTARSARSSTATCWPTTASSCARWSSLADLRPLQVAVDAGNGMAGHTAPAVLGPVAGDHAVSAVLRTRRHVPQPRGQPAGPGQPGRSAGARAGDRRRHRAGLRRRRRPVFRRGREGASGIAVSGDRPGRRARTEQGDRRDGDPQPDHLTGGARTGRSSGAARRYAAASVIPTSRR